MAAHLLAVDDMPDKRPILEDLPGGRHRVMTATNGEGALASGC